MEGIIPDVIPRSPKQTAVVTYAHGDVQLGNKLTPEQTASAPKSVSFQANSSNYYTLVMVDPDAPSRGNPKMKHWRHWLVINIPPSCDVEGGDIITPYAGPSPPMGSGPHRYVFLVYSQGSSRISERDVHVPEGRGKFNLCRFVASLGFGDVFASNYFLSERK